MATFGKILVTGDRGYIGSVLVPTLVDLGYEVRGIDAGYYENCLLMPYHTPYIQVNRDIREIKLTDVQGVDAVIHLAGLSNDPLGELSPSLTEEINYQATVKLAHLARIAGVKRFVYASSQSMYGVSDAENELDEDNSEKNPVTA